MARWLRKAWIGRAHVAGMTERTLFILLEEDITAAPIRAGLFGAEGIMLQTGGFTDLDEELFVLCGGMARFRHGKINKG